MTYQTFFQRKNLIRLAAITGAVYLLVLASFVIYGRADHYLKVRAYKADQARIAKLSSEKKAIAKSELYMENMITAAQLPQRLMFDYLQRTYNLSPELSVAEHPVDVPESGPNYPSEVNYLARIVYPDKVIKTPPKMNLEGISYTNIYAANCDNIPLSADFWTAMEKQYTMGGYYLTHDALAFIFMKNNGCIVPASAGDLSQRVTEGMVAIVKDTKNTADLRYEATAFLLVTGHRDQVKKSWINQIADEQLPDGSWAEKAGDKKSSDHTTLLAMWSLLAYDRPGSSSTPIIRH